ncbi:MAG: KEOPS complex kinase/ATPase Bud32 [Candidatus Thermoplasmatota archaeon]
MIKNKVLHQGAEAKIIAGKYLKKDIVEKRRISKKYRIKEIDQKLIEYRTKEEAKLINYSKKQGVSVPILYDVDKKEGTLVMQYVKGDRVKDIYNNLDEDKRINLSKKIGASIAKLHNEDIIHGDITTSNMIIKDNRVYFIDFGLGEINPEVEAKGVDLHVLMEAMESTHSQHSNDFKYVIESYSNNYKGDFKLIDKKIKEIIKRGRYR